MRKADALGMQYTGENRITLNLNSDNSKELLGILMHEMRHRQQEADGAWLRDSTRTNVYAANKVLEAEARNITSDVEEYSGNYFSRLKQKYIKELGESLKEDDIPYALGLTAEEKAQARRLYIETQAFERANADTITLLMQPNGRQTALCASQIGLPLTAEELESFETWRQYYRKQSIESAEDTVLGSESGDNAQRDADARAFRNYMEKQIPGLKGRDYFQSGVTTAQVYEDGLSFDSDGVQLRSGVTYFPGTQIKAQRVIANARGGYTVMVYNRSGNRIYEGQYDSAGRRHGRETWYDETGKNVTTTCSFKNGIPAGKCIRYYTDGYRREELFVDGKKVEEVCYDKQNLKYWERKGKDLDNHEEAQTNYDYKNGKLVNSYASQTGEWVGTAKEIEGDFEIVREYGQIQEGEKNVLMSYSERHRKTGALVCEQKRDTQNTELFHTTYYDEKGRKTSSGYMLADKNIPVGRWTKYNPDTKKSETVFFSGRLVKNEKGEMVPEKIPNPLDAMKKAGYRLNPENKNQYERPIKGKPGFKEVLFVDEMTGAIYAKGQLDPNGKNTGEWSYYRLDGTLKRQEQFDEKGTVWSVCFAEDGKTMTERNVRLENGNMLYDSFHGDGQTVSASWQMNGSDYVGDTSYYYANGNLSGVHNAECGIYYSPNGEILSEMREESGLFGFNRRTVTTAYYTSAEGSAKPGKRGPVKYEYTEYENGEVEVVYYRKDGTKLKTQTLDKDGKGTEIVYDSSGKVRAKGGIEDGKRVGEWEFPGRGTKVYQNGVEISRGLSRETTEEGGAAHRLAASCQRDISSASPEQSPYLSDTQYTFTA